MKKIKIRNNSFEIPYIEEEGANYALERRIFKSIISLISDYSCFVEYSCNDKAFSDFNILNYLHKSKYRKLIEVSEFIDINEKMLDCRYVIFFFMPKSFKWNDFVLSRTLRNCSKDYGANLILYLDDLGFVNITYNPKYDDQIKCIINKYNND